MNIVRDTMTRSQLREHTFRVLFSNGVDVGSTREEQIERYFIMEDEISNKDKNYIIKRCNDIEEELEVIDELLNNKTVGWKVSRMNKVDLAILRLAYYEISSDETVPTGVAINEAVELAKKYSSDEGPAFINGVLAKLIG